MGIKLLVTVVLVIFCSLASSFKNYDDFFKDIHSEEYYDTTASDEEVTMKKEIKTTKKPLSTYEVTENVVDIPNKGTERRPIVTNFTLTRPLNLVVNLNTTKIIDQDIEKKEETNKPKKNYINILHVKAEYDGNVAENVNVHEHQYFPGTEAFIHGVRKGTTHGINSVVNKGINGEVNKGVRVPNIVSHPILFLNKLHKKSSEVANRLHKAVFGHDFDVY